MKFYDIKFCFAVLACLSVVACSDGGQFVQISKTPTGQLTRVGESDLPSDRNSSVSGAISDSLGEGVGSENPEGSSVVVDGTVASSGSAGGGAASGSTGGSAASGSTGGGAASEGIGSDGHDCGDDDHDDCDDKEGSHEHEKTNGVEAEEQQNGGCDRES